MKKLIFDGGGSSKFWEAEVSGATLRIRFGKSGTAGQAQEKAFASSEAAQRELDKRAAEKVAKGYREVEAEGAGASGSAAAAAAAPASASAPAAAAAAAAASAAAPASASTSAPSAAPRRGGAELDAVVRLVRAKPGTPAAEHLTALTGGEDAAILGALVALNDVAAAAGDGGLYHAVLFALASFDDDRAWACLRAWLDAWRAANAPDDRGSPLGTGIDTIIRTGPPARVFATLGAHVADFRDGEGPRPIAARALQEAYLHARRGGALDPGWFELALSMLERHADLALPLQTIVALTEHPRRLDVLLERAEQGKTWPSLYDGLGRIADERAEAFVRKVLADGADKDAIEAARGVAGRGARALAPLVIDAACRVIANRGKNGVNLNALRDALLPLATAADAPKLRAAAKQARASEGFVSDKERTEFARDVDGLAKLIAERG